MKPIVFMMISAMSLNAQAERIEVFTTSTKPVALNGLKAQVCALDALNQITEELNRNTGAMASLSQPDEAIRARLTTFYRCQGQARHYALGSLPAIVIDKTYVVYGVRAVDKALLATRHYKVVHHA